MEKIKAKMLYGTLFNLFRYKYSSFKNQQLKKSGEERKMDAQNWINDLSKCHEEDVDGAIEWLCSEEGIKAHPSYAPDPNPFLLKVSELKKKRERELKFSKPQPHEPTSIQNCKYKSIWEKFTSQIKDRISQQDYNKYFLTVQIKNESSKLLLLLPNHYVKQDFDKKYLPLVAKQLVKPSPDFPNEIGVGIG